MSDSVKTRRLGQRGEDLAVDYVRRLGWTILDRNWRCHDGELDVVAHDPVVDEVVFVEVKTRAGVGFGDPLDAITFRKQRKLRQLCLLWMTEHGIGGCGIRLDAIGVLLVPDQPAQLTHVRGTDG